MKKRIFGVLLLLPMALFAQQKHRGADLNTVFVCLDSLTYSKLFEVPFVHDTLFFAVSNQPTPMQIIIPVNILLAMQARWNFLNPKALRKLVTGSEIWVLNLKPGNAVISPITLKRHVKTKSLPRLKL